MASLDPTRRMVTQMPSTRITELEPSQVYQGPARCMTAPDACNALPFYPCCCCWKLPDHIVDNFQASKYVHVNENSVVWNRPYLKYRRVDWGIIPYNPCQLEVRDSVDAMYFDDQRLNRVREKPRPCWYCLQGGCFIDNRLVGYYGEKVEMSSTFCGGLCLLDPTGTACLPACLPTLCHVCCCVENTDHMFDQRVLAVRDAKKAAKAITEARDNARMRMNFNASGSPRGKTASPNFSTQPAMAPQQQVVMSPVAQPVYYMQPAMATAVPTDMKDMKMGTNMPNQM